jgi:hypothetical protein
VVGQQRVAVDAPREERVVGGLGQRLADRDDDTGGRGEGEEAARRLSEALVMPRTLDDQVNQITSQCCLP